LADYFQKTSINEYDIATKQQRSKSPVVIFQWIHFKMVIMFDGVSPSGAQPPKCA